MSALIQADVVFPLQLFHPPRRRAGALRRIVDIGDIDPNDSFWRDPIQRLVLVPTQTETPLGQTDANLSDHDCVRCPPHPRKARVNARNCLLSFRNIQ